MFIPGVCAGALLTLFVLAFAAGSARQERPLHAEAQPFTVLIYQTVLPTAVTSTPDASTPAITVTMTPTPTTLFANANFSITMGERRARTPTGVLTTTLEAYFAREEICPIRPNTCAYSFLAGNLDAGIGFPASSSTFSMTNRLMHPAMLKPLATLRVGVLKRWMGQHALMVQGAYTDEAPAGNIVLALRAQGQLAVITLVPPPSADDLALLCGMAFRAGFDWVDNDGTACRVAMKAVSLCLACLSATPTPEPTSTVGIQTFTPVAPATFTPSPTNTPAAPNPPPDAGNAQAPVGQTPIP